MSRYVPSMSLCTNNAKTLAVCCGICTRFTLGYAFPLGTSHLPMFIRVISLVLAWSYDASNGTMGIMGGSFSWIHGRNRNYQNKTKHKHVYISYLRPILSTFQHHKAYVLYNDGSLYEPLQWRHNECDGVSNHQPSDSLLNRLFRRRSKKTSMLRVTGLCAGNSPVTGEFPAQRARNGENVSIWWRHHDIYDFLVSPFLRMSPPNAFSWCYLYTKCSYILVDIYTIYKNI